MSNYNCFVENTGFITDKGVKKFKDFEDGDKVNILDGYGSFSEAKVKNFGKQNLYELKIINNNRKTKTYKVTGDHIWYVNSINDFEEVYTKDLQKDDILKTQDINNRETKWKVLSVKDLNYNDQVWCVTDSKTESFTLDTGVHTHNCSFTTIDSIQSYLDIFYLLMIGSGTGFRVLEEDINSLPKLRTDIELIHKYYEPEPKNERREYTDFEFSSNDTVVTINIGDSKEGKLSCPSH